MILEATIIVTQILAYRDNSTQLAVTMNTICTVVLCDLTELSHVFLETNKHQNLPRLRGAFLNIQCIYQKAITPGFRPRIPTMLAAVKLCIFHRWLILDEV